VLVIPNGHNADSQFNLLKQAIHWVTNSNMTHGFGNRYIEIGDQGEIILAEAVFAE
jgi:hypothetical protein